MSGRTYTDAGHPAFPSLRAEAQEEIFRSRHAFRSYSDRRSRLGRFFAILFESFGRFHANLPRSSFTPNVFICTPYKPTLPPSTPAPSRAPLKAAAWVITSPLRRQDCGSIGPNLPDSGNSTFNEDRAQVLNVEQPVEVCGRNPLPGFQSKEPNRRTNDSTSALLLNIPRASPLASSVSPSRRPRSDRQDPCPGRSV